jgi:hypothetical protein
MAKPLMSRLLLENSNKVANIVGQLAPTQTPVSRPPSQGIVVDQGVEFATPRKKTDLRGHLNNLAIRKQDLSREKAWAEMHDGSCGEALANSHREDNLGTPDLD